MTADFGEKPTNSGFGGDWQRDSEGLSGGDIHLDVANGGGGRRLGDVGAHFVVYISVKIRQKGDKGH